MADVAPFRALHYDPSRVGIADVTAPPYDVIDPAGRAALVERSPNNVVELDLPEPEGGDKYEHAAELLRAWRADGVLVQDHVPTIWAYEQDYEAPGGGRRSRRGFLARVAVTDYGPGLVRPHERTQPGPKEDRLRLTRATGYNLSPIFVLHAGDAWRHLAPALGGEPFCEVTDPDGTVHRAWPIADPEVHDAVAEVVAGSELLIADGHHRYETARTYADEVGAADGDDARYTLACLVSLEDPGLSVFATHRLLHDLDETKRLALRDALMELFELEAIDDPADLVPAEGDGTIAFGYMDSFHRKPYRLRLRDDAVLAAALPDSVGGVPHARRGGARGSDPQRPARDERRRHRRQARPLLLLGLRRGGRPGRARRRRRRLLPAPHPGPAGPRRRRRRRDDAAEVDLLLPEAPDRDRLQPAVGGGRGRMKIYTRKGDDGTTGLWYGGRRPKSDARIEAYGTIDEAGSALGVARSLCRAGKEEVESDLLHLQRDLFVAGAELAAAPEAADRLEDGVSRITGEMVSGLEPVIDGYMDRVELPPKFVIPGGTELSAALDLARAILRRAERRVAALAAEEELPSTAVLAYLNRAADLVYAMARFTDVSDPALFEGRRGAGEQAERD